MDSTAFKFIKLLLTSLVLCVITSCDDSEENAPEYNLPEESAKFVGLWTINSSKKNAKEIKIMFFPDGSCLYDNKIGQWTFDKNTNILATTIASQYNVTLSSNEAWTGIDLSNTATATASKGDQESEYFFIRMHIIPQAGEKTRQTRIGRCGVAKELATTRTKSNTSSPF